MAVVSSVHLLSLGQIIYRMDIDLIWVKTWTKMKWTLTKYSDWVGIIVQDAIRAICSLDQGV